MEEGNYKNQNQELRALHQQRMARLKKQKGEQIQIQEQTKTVSKDVKDPKSKKINEIYLNAVIYDKRPINQRHNAITLPHLMNLSVNTFPTQPVSKEVEAVMITNYGFEMEVFEPIVKCGIPLYVFNREEGENKEGKVTKCYQGFHNMTVISPPKLNSGYGVFHPKLWLIKFKNFLRVVVCTGNNHLYDWAIWQNAYWFHDCPLKTLKQNQSKQKKQQFNYAQDFQETLSWIISQIQPSGFDILKEMKIDLNSYSYKDVKAILIPSFSGRFKEDNMNKVGLGKVRKIMKDAKINMKNAKLTANSTSLGNPDEKLMRQVYGSFCPSAGLFGLDVIRLVYPTDKYISQRSCGEAGVLFLTPQNYQKCKIKKHIFHRYEPSAFNGVEGSIPHLKTIILQEGSRIVLYMGSHNLTKAAWGSFEKYQTQISCNNEQLGLLFLQYPEQQLLQWLPYAYPPEKYSVGELPFLRHIQ